MPQPFADQFRSIPMSPGLRQSLERARDFAREQGHRTVTLEHLLLAFTEDEDAAAVLHASNVDVIRLGTDVSGYLGRLLEDMRGGNSGDPTTDPELLRVLHAAVQAAQQSRRRQIDGAIVLAAVVGDGKSPAAGLLKSHGLTFEEAIRALQKANAKARSKQFTPAPSQPAPAPPAAETVPAPAPVPSASPDPAAARDPEATAQSVEDILAAARERIQQRTSAIVGRTTPPGQAAPAPTPNPEPPQLSGLDPANLADEPLPPESDDAADMTEVPQQAPSLAQPTTPAAPTGHPAWTPPAASRQGQPLARKPLNPPPQRPVPPFQQRPIQAGEGPPRPPLPGRTGPPGALAPPQPFPGGSPQAPWPTADQRPQPNGALTADPANTGVRRPGQRTGGQPGHGPLVETIPRRMRLGVSSSAQVRIGRDRIDGLIQLLMKGRGLAHRPDALAMRALSVRLRAPDGKFWIEADTPETQWVEASTGHHQDDHIGWRWTITPQQRGRGRLVLVVAARTVGHDGLAAEAAPPDRVIEVTVTGGRLRGIARWGALLAALLLGALLDRFGGEFWAFGVALVKGIAAL